MTLCCTTILGYCRVQLKKWQTCHRVPRGWPHLTVCWSPGHGIGRPGLMVTSRITGQISRTWEEFWVHHNRAGAIFASGNGRDVIQDDGWKCKWLLPLLWWTKTIPKLLPMFPTRIFQTLQTIILIDWVVILSTMTRLELPANSWIVSLKKMWKRKNFVGVSYCVWITCHH